MQVVPEVNAGRHDGIVIISQLADAITINESECNSRLPVQRIFPGRNLSTCKNARWKLVRRRKCGLSRRSEDYDVRILPTARHYYGWVQLPRNPDR